MTLRIPIPEDLSEPLVRRLHQDAREAIAVRLYKEGELSTSQFASYLGIDRGEVDELLARHGVADEFTVDEIAEQARALRPASGNPPYSLIKTAVRCSSSATPARSVI